MVRIVLQRTTYSVTKLLMRKKVVCWLLVALLDSMVRKQIGTLIMNYMLWVLNRNTWVSDSSPMCGLPDC